MIPKTDKVVTLSILGNKGGRVQVVVFLVIIISFVFDWFKIKLQLLAQEAI